jgi:nucleotide-binding universal stress UspA family protein
VEETMTAKRILVPLDGSESAETAAAVAADLARSSGGSVRLLRVSPVPKQWVGDYGRVVVYADQEMERLTAEGRDYLETVGAQLPAVPIESVVRFGEPAEEILVEAEAFGADTIVLATRRPSWLKRVTGGGIGQWLLSKAPVPVVLVRPT